MQEQEREWKANVEASIKLKEERSKIIQQEKEAQKRQVCASIIKQLTPLSNKIYISWYTFILRKACNSLHVV